jgi:hypothetical protein
MALLDVEKRVEANQIARQVEYTELSVHPDFQDEFVAAMPFPHGRDSFPHLQDLFARARDGRRIRQLRRIPALAGLPREALLSLAQAAEDRTFKRREELYAADSDAGYAYFLRKGKVGFFQTVDGQEEEVGQAKDGELVGDEALLDGRPYATTARALALTEALALPRQVMQEAVRAGAAGGPG